MVIDENDKELQSPSYHENEKWEHMASVFKLLSDSTRLKIVHELISKKQRIIDIAKDLNMSLPAISYHIKLLKGSDVIKGKRNGKSVIYEINDKLIQTLYKEIFICNCVVNSTIKQIQS